MLGQEADVVIYGKESGVIETSKTRSGGVAQWEIRNRIGIPLVKEMAKYEDLRKEVGPRCWREKICTEPATFKIKKTICRAFEKSKGNWKGNLEELLELLEEKFETFTLSI